MKVVKCIDATGMGAIALGKDYEVVREDSMYYFLKGIGGGWLKFRFLDTTQIPAAPPTQPSAVPPWITPGLQQEIDAVIKSISEAHAKLLQKKEIHCKAPACGKANDFGCKTCYLCGNSL